MVSQRQREARKRFKETNPGLFPKPEPTPPKDPNKKKKNKFKRKKKDNKNNDLNKPKKSIEGGRFNKHPLRVPGMKPGDSCYICKGKDHIAKLCPEKSEWEKNKICLKCRRRGHSLKNCPYKDDDEGDVDIKTCYNCGEIGHSLDKCRRPLQDGGTKFASCFVCNERGHLSKNCPKNARGIYPKGGCCKVCGGVTHLAKDCPHEGQEDFVRPETEAMYAVRPKLTKFTSGDDLDDDFIIAGGAPSGKGVKPSETKDDQVKSNKGPKVTIQVFYGIFFQLIYSTTKDVEHGRHRN
ncbi:hypothetical protein ACFE04_004634 [Oxalis oulophora]